jgi:hypothetical protein
MAIIRSDAPRIFSDGPPMYVYPATKDGRTVIELAGQTAIDGEDMAEVVLRVMIRAGWTPALRDANKIREALTLPPLVDGKEMRRRMERCYYL